MKAWSFSRQVAEELSHRPLQSEPELWSELLGIGVGQPLTAKGFVWVLASPLAVRRAYRIVKALKLSTSVELKRRERRISYLLSVDGAVDRLSLAYPLKPGPFLRGCFLTHGYMNSPERGPHVEFRIAQSQAKDVVGMLKKIRVKAGTMPHHGGVTLYVKGQEGILRLLAEMGAHQSLLQMESLRVVRSVKNQVNRLVNSETANLVRTVESGVEQARLLSELSKTPEWESLSDGLLLVAKIRLTHPDWSLREIGQAMNPPLSKSAVNHRMRRLLRIAQEHWSESSFATGRPKSQRHPGNSGLD